MAARRSKKNVRSKCETIMCRPNKLTHCFPHSFEVLSIVSDIAHQFSQMRLSVVVFFVIRFYIRLSVLSFQLFYSPSFHQFRETRIIRTKFKTSWTWNKHHFQFLFQFASFVSPFAFASFSVHRVIQIVARLSICFLFIRLRLCCLILQPPSPTFYQISLEGIKSIVDVISFFFISLCSFRYYTFRVFYLLPLVKFMYLIPCAISIRNDAMHESGKYNIIVHPKRVHHSNSKANLCEA